MPLKDDDMPKRIVRNSERCSQCSEMIRQSSILSFAASQAYLATQPICRGHREFVWRATDGKGPKKPFDNYQCAQSRDSTRVKMGIMGGRRCEPI
jgi:hypothetical protein